MNIMPLMKIFMLIILATACGCSTVNVSLPWKNKIPTADDKHPVIETLALWQAGEGRGLDHMPSRGFIGQVLFFAAGIESPVKVEGKVTVYVFDDFGSREEQKKPIHEFTFDTGSWNNYLKDTNFGPAYQIFIPYTRPGSHFANCSLRVKLEPEENTRPVFSDVANVVLKGTKKQKSDIQQVSAEMPLDGDQSSHRQLNPLAISSTANLDTAPTEASQADVSRAKLPTDQWGTMIKNAQTPGASNQLKSLEQMLENAARSRTTSRTVRLPVVQHTLNEDAAPDHPLFRDENGNDGAYSGQSPVGDSQHPLE